MTAVECVCSGASVARSRNVCGIGKIRLVFHPDATVEECTGMMIPPSEEASSSCLRATPSSICLEIPPKHHPLLPALLSMDAGKPSVLNPCSQRPHPAPALLLAPLSCYLTPPMPPLAVDLAFSPPWLEPLVFSAFCSC